MALLDVSDILTDPDFVSFGILCERQSQTVGDDGLAINVTDQMKFSGVITSDNGDLLVRSDSGERIKGNINIHTRFPLVDGQDGRSADIVIWKGRRYTVSSVNDWSDYGRGFVRAICDLIPVTG